MRAGLFFSILLVVESRPVPRTTNVQDNECDFNEQQITWCLQKEESETQIDDLSKVAFKARCKNGICDWRLNVHDFATIYQELFQNTDHNIQFFVGDVPPQAEFNKYNFQYMNHLPYTSDENLVTRGSLECGQSLYTAIHMDATSRKSKKKRREAWVGPCKNNEDYKQSRMDFGRFQDGRLGGYLIFTTPPCSCYFPAGDSEIISPEISGETVTDLDKAQLTTSDGKYITISNYDRLKEADILARIPITVSSTTEAAPSPSKTSGETVTVLDTAQLTTSEGKYITISDYDRLKEAGLLTPVPITVSPTTERAPSPSKTSGETVTVLDTAQLTTSEGKYITISDYDRLKEAGLLTPVPITVSSTTETPSPSVSPTVAVSTPRLTKKRERERECFHLSN